MKPLIIIVVFIIQLGIGHKCLAQQTYYFNYDSTGNRTFRTITLSSGNLKSTSDKSVQESNVFKESIDEININIYPNPTNGQITIDIKGFDEQQTSIISLYDFSGRLLKSKGYVSESNIVDLSELPNAIYILKIVIGDKNSQWKIIKQ